MITDCSSTHRVENFSTPNVEVIAGVKIQRLPAGAAIGSHDLERWSNRRSAGLAKAYSTKAERQMPRQWTKPPATAQALTREDAVKRGIFVEHTSRGWLVSLPSGRTLGPYWLEAEALRAVARVAR
jgi:hypothetical protein